MVHCVVLSAPVSYCYQVQCSKVRWVKEARGGTASADGGRLVVCFCSRVILTAMLLLRWLTWSAMSRLLATLLGHSAKSQRGRAVACISRVRSATCPRRSVAAALARMAQAASLVKKKLPGCLYADVSEGVCGV
jgi:hypothetical protein